MNKAKIMKQLTFSELFDTFHAGPDAQSMIVWDGDSNFTYIKSLWKPESEPIKITDLVRTADDTEQIISAFKFHRKKIYNSYCDEFQIFLKTLFSSKALDGYFIWHEDGSGHSLGIARTSSEEMKSGFYWSEEWDQWVYSGDKDILTHCSPKNNITMSTIPDDEPN